MESLISLAFLILSNIELNLTFKFLISFKVAAVELKLLLLLLSCAFSEISFSFNLFLIIFSSGFFCVLSMENCLQFSAFKSLKFDVDIILCCKSDVSKVFIFSSYNFLSSCNIDCNFSFSSVSLDNFFNNSPIFRFSSGHKSFILIF